MADDFNDNESSSSPIWDFLKWVVGGVVAIFAVKTVADSIDRSPKPEAEKTWIDKGVDSLKDLVETGEKKVNELTGNTPPPADATKTNQERAGTVKAVANTLGTAGEIGVGAAEVIVPTVVAYKTLRHPIDNTKKLNAILETPTKLLEEQAEISKTKAQLKEALTPLDEVANAKNSWWNKTKDFAKSGLSKIAEIPGIKQVVAYVDESPMLKKVVGVGGTKAIVTLGAVDSLKHASELGEAGKKGAAYAEGVSGTAEAVLMGKVGVVGTLAGTIVKDYASIANYVATGENTVSRSMVSNAIGSAGGDKAAEFIMEHGVGKALMTAGKGYDFVKEDVLGFKDVAETSVPKALATPPQAKTETTTLPKG